MTEIEKSYNKFRKQYRLERQFDSSENWDINFVSKNVLDLIIQTNYVLSPYKYRLKPYNYYFLRLVLWSVKRIYKDVKTELKNPTKRHLRVIVSGVIISIISTAILKFILHWI